MGNITDLIKDVANKNQIIETFAAKVIEINKEAASLHNADDAYTVNVMRADGAIIKNVRLKASIQDKEEGIITIPKKDSWVLTSIIDGVETRAFISQFSEIERTFIRFKNDKNQYLEIDTDVNKFQVLFKEKKASESGTSSTAKPTYKNIAQIVFNGSTPDPNFSTSFYDANGKEISKNSFNINEQKISINEGKTIFNLKDKEVKITIKDGFEAKISDAKTSFIKGNLTFEMDDKFKIDVGGKSLKSKLEELIDEIGKITVPTPVGPSGPPINLPKLITIKGKLTELLK
jgi:formylmethanofuran dehydrogenase subunit D